MVQRTKLRMNNKTYLVVFEGEQVLRISYVNAVRGEQPLDMSGVLARKVVEQFKKQRGT